MAKKFYAPVSGSSKEVKKFYAPVNGSSVKIVKAYCSVGGVSKCFYEEGGDTPLESLFWFNYATKAGKIIDGKRYTVVPNQVPVEIKTVQNGIVFYFFIQQIEGGSIVENIVVTVSTDSNATRFNAICQGQTDSYVSQDFIDIHDSTGWVQNWYYTTGAPLVYDYAPQYPTDISPDCVVTDPSIVTKYDIEDIIFEFLMSHIYVDDFGEEYVDGNSYNLVLGDKEKTIRKIIAIFLFMNASKSIANYYPYRLILTRLEDIVSICLSEMGNANACMVGFYFNAGSGQSGEISMQCYYDTLQPVTGTLNYSRHQRGYTYFFISPSVTLTNYFQLHITDSTIYVTRPSGQISSTIKVGVVSSDNSNYYSCELSSVGVYSGSARPFYKFHEDYQQGQAYVIYTMPFTTFLNNMLAELMYFLNLYGVAVWETAAEILFANLYEIYDFFTMNLPTYQCAEFSFAYALRKSDIKTNFSIEIYYYDGGRIAPRYAKESALGYDFYTLYQDATSTPTQVREFRIDYSGIISKTINTESYAGPTHMGIYADKEEDSSYFTALFNTCNMGIDLKGGFT